MLLDFVRQNEPLNPVLCGYFCKLLAALMNHSRKEFAAFVFSPRDNTAVEHLIKHISNRSIADILVKVLAEDSGDPELQTRFVLSLLDAIKTQDLEGKLNSALVLCEIVDSRIFADVFRSDNVNARLIGLLKLDSDLSVRAALTVAASLYKKYPLVQLTPTQTDDSNAFAKTYLTQSDSSASAVPEHIDALLKEGLNLIEDILTRQPVDTLDQQYGSTIRPFGATRLQAVKLIYQIVAQGNTQYTLRLVP